ncbi:methylase [Rhodococcus sp. 06-235-1A]|uniref:HemK2/MTQ2 family protein methyltransferase n=1 Tax=Rhodococcus sp. 06-235-1A TaxID=2022508 RepID=UPI000B9BAFB1|nr:HemK2/MTQ2 family protein methyltransferase [Rhodococcus sp. 06-235-1A]OZC99376.1 methylase [Rhodococcus sp. 06-235-1A]
MTTTEFETFGSTRALHAEPGVYEPQDDSWLLCEMASQSGVVQGARVLDMCTGSGAVALAAASMGAREVVAFDISALAVACARRNAVALGLEVDVRRGSFAEAAALEPFDVILCNPPYVPSEEVPTGEGPHRAWDGGRDGRIVLDPLCDAAHELLVPGGTLMVVHSEYSDPDRTQAMLRSNGMTVTIVARRSISFGPVMTQRAAWLEQIGLLESSRDIEDLVVFRADRR